MNSISFGSTFRIKNNDQMCIYPLEIMNFCDENGLDYRAKAVVEKRLKGSFYMPVYGIRRSIIAPDLKDDFVETFLINKGISFNKIATKDLLDTSKIALRIENPPKYMRVANVDTQRLDKILHNQTNNIEHCKKHYEDYYKKSVDLIIKSGNKISTTTLYITPTGESLEDSLDYIKKFGNDRLNKDQFMFTFSQLTDEPDHCMFFGFKDMGMREVPVYVDNNTYRLGNALGLFK